MPPLILALDTAFTRCTAAVYDPAGEGRLLAAAEPDIGTGHAERLTGVIDDVLTEAGATHGDLARIVVTTGPGSFTGIRVGVAAARGLALALDIPALGVSDAADPLVAVLTRKLSLMRRKHAQTREYMEMNALRGIVKDGAGTTLYNYFTEFGLAQISVDFVLGTAGTNVQGKVREVLRAMGGGMSVDDAVDRWGSSVKGILKSLVEAGAARFA